MQTNELIPTQRGISGFLFWGAALTWAMEESLLINRIHSDIGNHLSDWSDCFVPIYFIFPVLFAFVFRFRTKKWVIQGEMTPNVAGQVDVAFAGLAMFSNMLVSGVQHLFL